MLVFPSLIEGFGLVLLEAFEAKKPVLVSDVSRCNEIVENAIDGFILPPVDAKNIGLTKFSSCFRTKMFVKSWEGKAGKR